MYSEVSVPLRRELNIAKGTLVSNIGCFYASLVKHYYYITLSSDEHSVKPARI